MKKLSLTLCILMILSTVIGTVKISVSAEEGTGAPAENAELEIGGDAGGFSDAAEDSSEKTEGVDYETEYLKSELTEEESAALEKAYSFHSAAAPYNNDIIGEAYEQYQISLPGAASVNAAPSSYTELAIPSTTTVTTTSASKKLYYKIVPSATGRYCIKSDSGTGGDTYARLLNASGTQLAYCDSGLMQPNVEDFHINEVLVKNTTYYIEVQNKNGAGSFKMYIFSDDYLDGTYKPAELTFGENKTGTINYTFDHDMFKFVPSESGTYSFFTTGTTDTFGYLVNSSNTVLASNDDGGQGNNFKIEYALTKGQTYYVSVQGYGNRATGNYTMCVGIAESSMTVLNNNSSVQAAFSGGAADKWFKFTPPASGRYCIKSRSESLDTSAVFYDSGFAEKAHSDIGYVRPNWDDFHINEILTGGKTYYLKVKMKTESGGSVYIDSFSDDYLDGSFAAEAVETDVEKNGVINYASDHDMFKYIPSGSENNIISIESSADLKVDIYASNDSYVKSASGKNISLPHNSAGGFYYIDVYKNTGIGSYKLKVTVADTDVSSAETVTIPSVKNASSGKVFKIVPAVSGKYSIKSVTESSVTYGSLYDNHGKLLFTYTDGRSGENVHDFHIMEALEKDKIYYFKVTSSGSGNIPVYFYEDDNTDGTNSSGGVPLQQEVFAAETNSSVINYTSDRDVFIFRPVIAGEYEITADKPQVSCVVYSDFEHTKVAANSDGNYDLTEGRTYYIDFYASGSYKGGFNFDINMLRAAQSYSVALSNELFDINVKSGASGFFELGSGISGIKTVAAKSAQSGIELCLVDDEGKNCSDLAYDTRTEQFSSFYNFEEGKKYYLKVLNNGASDAVVYAAIYNDDRPNANVSVTADSMGKIHGKINFDGDVDVYRFTAPQSGTVHVRSEGENNLTFKVFAGTSTTGQQQTGKKTDISVNAENGGDLYVYVSHASEIGVCDYDFSVDMIDFSESACTELSVGTSASANLESADDYKLFSFVPEKTAVYSVVTGSDAKIEIYDYFRSLKKTTDGYAADSTNLNCDMKKGKKYFIKISCFKNDENYLGNIPVSITEDDFPGEQYSNAPVLGSGSLQKGYIEMPGDEDSFIVSVETSGLYDIVSAGGTDVKAQLYSGDEMISEDNDGGDGKNFKITAELSGGSSYRLCVSGGTGGSVGAYRIYVNPAPALKAVYGYAARNDIVNVEFTKNGGSGACVYTLNYDSEAFEIYDLCGLTFALETEAAAIGNVTVNSVTPGKIVFTAAGGGADIYAERVENIIRLKAKKDGAFVYTWSCTNS